MKALLIIAKEGYQDYEYSIPKNIFEQKGIEIITASKEVGICKGKLGSSNFADLSLQNVKVKDYDIILFIGGPGAVSYQNNSFAHKIAQEAVKENKILAAICIGPTILAYAGILKNKKATVWNGDNEQELVLKKNGATYTGEEVTIDGKIVTANGPEAAEKFAQAILKLTKSKN